ncbi:MAG: hypothetical protein HY077_16260 [Elusimicrobia bacterium]|nr:hypothetical protein [Elusimicrobiota bacterium]
MQWRTARFPSVESSSEDRAGLPAAWIALSCAPVLAVAWLWFSGQTRTTMVSGSGFDLRREAPAPSAPRAARKGASGIDMVWIDFEGGQDEAAAPIPAASPAAEPRARELPAAAPAGPEAGFTEQCRGFEGRMAALNREYDRKYPSWARLGQDWARDPVLHGLDLQYGRDHDAAKFLRGLAAAPSFGQILKKYAGDPAMLAVAQDAMRQAPAGLLSSATGLLSQGGPIKSLVENAAGAIGFPVGLLGSLPKP